MEEITPEQRIQAQEVAERLQNSRLSKAKQFVKTFAEKLGHTVEELMADADRFVESGEYTLDNSEGYKQHWSEFDEFWTHYEVITGKRPDSDSSFYTCSC